MNNYLRLHELIFISNSNKYEIIFENKIKVSDTRSSASRNKPDEPHLSEADELSRKTNMVS
jgi:hypothetical protein